VPRWLPRLLRRIHELVGRGQVRFTLKAIRELAALGAGLDAQDGCDVLVGLTADKFAQRLKSESTGEWMYVFKSSVASTTVYVKLILRAEGLVVSFHEDEGESDEEQS
jgi:hypothetical protein